MREFWTMFRYGSADVICSKHRTVKAAKRAARNCEKQGGAKHWIVVASRLSKP